MLNLGMNLQRLAVKGGLQFTPASLFNNGEAGVWYDPSAASGSLDWRKNLFEYTESFDNSYWTPTRGNISAASIIDPTGGTDAYSWTATEFTETYIDRRQGISKTIGSTVTLSCFIKKETADYCHLLLWDSSANGVRCWFNLVNGSVGSNTSFGSTYTFNDASVTDAGNGWYRCVLTVNASAGSSVVGRFSPSNGDGDVTSSAGKSIYLWGAQLEEASTASSYQPILSTFENAFKTAFPSHTLYQDSQGVTPVTAVGEPVGLMLDKSEGLAQGPELVTNGDFATNLSGWSGAGWVWSNGKAYDSGASVTEGLEQILTTVADRIYVIEYTLSGISGGTPSLKFEDQTVATHPTDVTNGRVIVRAATINSKVEFIGGGATFSIDNVSVTEIQGSHATQPTSTKRPIYARHPEGGIRNLLNYTEQFDNGYWSRANSTVTANATTAPDGTATADKFIATSANSDHSLKRGVSVTGCVYSVYAKAGEYDKFMLWLRLSSKGYGFNLTSGTTFSVGGITDTTSNGIEDVGNGWYRCWIYVSDAVNRADIYLLNSTTYSNFAGNNSDGIYLWGAQLEEATEASNYQKRVTDIDVTESGVGEVYYLKFDGTDDGMFINNLTSPNTPLTALFGYSATNAESSSGKYLFDIQTGRTVLSASSNSVGWIGYYEGAWSEFAADANAIKVLTYDLVEDDAKIRIDGTQEYSDTTYDQKAIGGDIALFQNFSGDNTGRNLAGNMYQTILRAAESTDEEIAKAETYVANKTGLKAQVDGIATLDLNFGNNTYTAKNSNGGVI